jgi:hypothetical protein
MIDSTKIGSCDIMITSVALFASYDSCSTSAPCRSFLRTMTLRPSSTPARSASRRTKSCAKTVCSWSIREKLLQRSYRVLVSKEPVNSVEDVKGLRFRAYENKIYMEAWNVLGANPIIVPWGETYSALMQGTVDAATSTIGQLYGVKFTEVAPNVANIREYTAEAIMVANAKMWDSLTDEQRTILTECANEAGEKMAEWTDAETDPTSK